MLIYNTTFHVDEEITPQLITYLKNNFIPVAETSGFLFNPELRKVLMFDEEKGDSICLQFHVKNMETLNYWLEKDGQNLHQALVKQFGQNVVGFSTLLEEISLKK